MILFVLNQVYFYRIYVPVGIEGNLALVNICCSNSNSQDNILFQNIVNFRNQKKVGPLDEGENITGIDIRNYLYYSLLDLVAIDIANNPLTEESRTENQRGIFKDTDDSVKLTECYGDINDRSTNPNEWYSNKIIFPKYPQIGNKFSTNPIITNFDGTCNDFAEQHEDIRSSINFIINYPFLDDKETLNYSDYESLSKWISSLDIDNDYDKLILISELEQGGNLRENRDLNDIINIIDSSNTEFTKDSIKKNIIKLTKEVNINRTSAKYTPLDRFFILLLIIVVIH